MKIGMYIDLVKFYRLFCLEEGGREETKRKYDEKVKVFSKVFDNIDKLY